jgi:hypothetical protein
MDELIQLCLRAALNQGFAGEVRHIFFQPPT